MNTIQIILLVLSCPVIVLPIIMWAMYPASILFELRQKTSGIFPAGIKVSIIVPAYNEEVVLGPCLKSILESNHRNLELIVVDDGSTDNTLQVAKQFETDPRVQVLTKVNGGKGSALNYGISQASGRVLIFVDADGLFRQDTIEKLLAGFRHEKVGAVCGNDRPVNVTGPLTALLALMTHVGTGMTRRALALVDMLPIVAGNSGAFRADVIHQIGGFRQDTVGEDLELTWRVQFAGWSVEFAPDAVVLAEVPDKLSSLWKQRVRWQRGLIQTTKFHSGRFKQKWRRPVDAYLPFNLLALLVSPILQLISIPVVVVGLAIGQIPLSGYFTTLLGSTLLVSVGVAILSIGLDRAWKDLRFLPVVVFWLPFSIMMSLVTVRAIWLEATKQQSQWHKLERTGIKNMVVAPHPS